MFLFPPTIILRHRRENLRKCSLRGLENREDLRFFTYPKHSLPPIPTYILLTLDAPTLTPEDSDRGLLLVDGTWRHTQTILRTLPPMECRSLPQIKTAYPRRQEDCPQPDQGLASVEALYIAYTVLGRDTTGLLDQYHWKESFLNRLCQVSP